MYDRLNFSATIGQPSLHGIQKDARELIFLGISIKGKIMVAIEI